MTSLTDLPTKCRFAVLEVSDDEDKEKPKVVDVKAGSAKCADANNDGKAKKKRRKKKSRGKKDQVLTTEFSKLFDLYLFNFC